MDERQSGRSRASDDRLPAASAPGGWWQAEDGYWYPPREQPTEAGVTPGSPTPPPGGWAAALGLEAGATAVTTREPAAAPPAPAGSTAPGVTGPGEEATRWAGAGADTWPGDGGVAAPPPPPPPPPPAGGPAAWAGADGELDDDPGDWTRGYPGWGAGGGGGRGRGSDLADTYRSWPRWARIGAPIAAVVVVLLVIGAIAGPPPEDATETSAGDTATTEAPATTDRPSTTAAPATTAPPTTAPPTTTTTAPPATTAPPTTRPAPPPTPAPAPPPTPAPAPATTAPQPACHPSYSGCVPMASDVDCSGGSGDGPAYTGAVRVIGPDVYDLDSDGDGMACEA